MALLQRAVGHATASPSSVPVFFLKAFDERDLLTYYLLELPRLDF